MNLMNGKTDAGVLALFESPESLVHAIEQVRAQKIKALEAYTPFPIHEVIHALGICRSKIPYGTLVMCLFGASLGFLFQSFTMAIDWPINVAGKPFISWPAFIPITFELSVLMGGISTVLLLFALCKLPNRKKPVLDERLTDHLFGLFIENKDPHFNEEEVLKIFKECHAKEIKHF